MRAALEILGYENPYHFSSVYGNIKDTDMWMEALRAKYKGVGKFGREEWDSLLGHVGAVTDSPCIIFAPELMNAYPDAKVILVERDVESWYKSWENLLVNAFNPLFVPLTYTDPTWYGKIQALGMLCIETQIQSKTLAQAKMKSRDIYKDYYKQIRAITPKERLLEYKLGSGWEPLCTFLGKEMPDVPFPRLNERESMTRVFEQMGIKAIKRSMVNLGLMISASTVVGIAIYYGRT
ncbi:hypothetical protein MMC13_007297 [Lambiella insularis]|nr:hypothetical protein [Lambiella insularis]